MRKIKIDNDLQTLLMYWFVMFIFVPLPLIIHDWRLALNMGIPIVAYLLMQWIIYTIKVKKNENV